MNVPPTNSTMHLAGACNKRIFDAICEKLDGCLGCLYFKCLVVGGAGWGKTTLCSMIASQMAERMDVFEVKQHIQADTEARMRTLITNFVTSRTIMSFLSPKKPKLVIIDDVDMHMRTDRGYTSFLLDLVAGKEMELPVHVVFACQLDEFPKLPPALRRTLGKERIFNINPPSPDECAEYVHNAYPNIDIDRLSWLAQFHRGNVRHVINDIEAGRWIGTNVEVETAEDKVRALSSMCGTASDLYKLVLDSSPPLTCVEIVQLGNPVLLTMFHDNLVFEMHKNRFKMAESMYFKFLTNAYGDRSAAATMDSYLDDTLGTIVVDWDLLDCAYMTKLGRTYLALNTVRKRKTRSTQGTQGTQGTSHSKSLHGIKKRLNLLRDAILPGADDDALYVVMMQVMAKQCTDGMETPLIDSIKHLFNGIGLEAALSRFLSECI